MTNHHKNISLQLAAVSVGAVLLLGKFFAYSITNSSTVLTDALESIINVAAGGLSLYSLFLSARPKDENHPYGHGKVEFISAGVEGTLISLAGALIIVQAIASLWRGEANIQKIDIGIYIVSFAGLVNYFMGYLTEKQGHKTGSLALIAGGKHLKSDAYSTVGMVFGLGLVYLLQTVWQEALWAHRIDNLMALLFGAIIAWTGYGILRKSVAGIMDEVDYELVESLVKVLNEHRQPNWIDIHNLRVIKYGGALHIDSHLTVPWYFNTIEAHAEVEAIEELMRQKVDNAIELFIHVDPCIESSCKICQKTECPVRKFAFEGKVNWIAQNIMLNKKHGAAN